MKRFLGLSTRAKLFLGFGLMIILLATVAVTAYLGITAIQKSQKKVEEDFANAVDLKDVRSNQNGVRSALLTMMLVANRSDQEELYQEIKARVKEIGETMAELFKRSQDDPQLLRSLEEFDAIRGDFQQTRDTEVIPLIYEGKVEGAKRLFLGIQAERDNKMRSIVDELVDGAVKKAEMAVIQSERSANASIRIFAIISLIALLLGVAIVLLLNRIIRQVTSEIAEGVNVLGSSASEILAATTQVASGAAETATAVSETTTTVEEVKQTAQVSSQKAKYVSESAQKAAQVSQTGKRSLEETVEGMSHIREQMESIAQSIVRLSEQSQAIGEIIATVNDLAEQSNLLAVNAAIEAAKGGEQGKGFAVVAGEVKSLAEQSKQATAQVRTILGDIQKATSAVVMATEQGSKAVEEGVKQVTEAAKSIRVMSDSVAESAQAATQIAASSQQQLVGMDQVALAMENIKQASAQNVGSTRQAEAAAQSLHELGQKLKQLVEQYKV